MKGQWFLISAVLATSAFLSISLVLKDYFVVDASEQARGREDFYLWDLKEQFEGVVQQSACADMEKNLNSYIAFARNHLWSSGYLVYIEYDKTPGKTKFYTYECDDTHPQPERRRKNIDKGIVVATEDGVYYFNLEKEGLNRIIPNVL